MAALTLIASPSNAQTTRLSVDGSGQEGLDSSILPDVSWDGRHVVFQSKADLAPGFHTHGTHHNIFVRDREMGTITTLDEALLGGSSWGDSKLPSISADGRFVCYFSEANLTSTPGSGIYLYDRDPDENGVFDEGNGFNTLVSLRLNGDAAAWIGQKSRISGNGRWVAYHSADPDIVAADNNAFTDVFLYDRLSGNTVRGSLGPNDIEADASSWDCDLSYDGRHLTFTSDADNLAPHQANHDIYHRDRDPDGNGIFDENNGVLQLVSQSTAGLFGNHNSDVPRISGSGDRIIFQSVATTLVPGFIFSDTRIYLRDVSTGITTLESVDSFGDEAWNHSYAPDISPDGRFGAFHSASDDLVGGDINGDHDIFLRDFVTGITTLASYGPGGVWGDGRSDAPALPVGATSVVFGSSATNFVAGDTNLRHDIFALDGANASSQWLHVGGLQRNAMADVDAYGFHAGERVFLLRGLGGIGIGQCPPPLGGLCIDLLNPVVLQMSELADTFGHVSFEDLIPASVPLIELHFQAVAPRGVGGIDSVKSSTASAWITP